LLAAFVLVTCWQPLHAQKEAAGAGYPSKPIRLILPFPAGGPTDILGRAVAEKLSDTLGVNVIPDNRPGAGGNIGLELAANAPADGYTAVLSSPAIALSPALYKKLAYDAERDLKPIARLARMNNVLVVHPSVPVRTLKEFVALARKSPGKLNYGSGGAGTTNHLANELLMTLTGIEMVHVPYKGATQAAVALMGGEVDQVIVSVPSSLTFIRAGKVRPLAIVSADRVKVLPDVPSAAEAGLPQFEMPIWYGLFAPSGIPDAAAQRLQKATTAALNSPDLREKLLALGVEPWSGSAQELGSHVRAETRRYAEIVKKAGIPPR
jgi:tripartite-type tricarboxylate transporter receptor subunit TctC